METKKCRNCSKELGIDEFHKHDKNSYKPDCKICFREKDLDEFKDY